MAGGRRGRFVVVRELEDDLDRRGGELLRRLLQDHLDLRAEREQRVEVLGDGVTHGSVEVGHARQLSTVFGVVVVERRAYRLRGETNLHPADAALNLPAERHSHGLRRLAAVESTRGSYEEAAEAIGRGTGVAVAKRQVEELAAARPPTSTASMRPPRPSQVPATACWWSPSTARASSWVPTRCAPPPSGGGGEHTQARDPVCPKAKSETESASPRWARSMTSPLSPQPCRGVGLQPRR